MFDAGELRLVLLRLLQDQPRHGYDLIREIESMAGGAYAPSPGIVYPTLTLLEDLEHVEAQKTAGAKRLFALTPAGRAHLDQHRAEIDGAMERLKALGSERTFTDSGPVWRAMQNLKTVLQQTHQRLAGASKDKQTQTLLDVSELIDEAARKIERLASTSGRDQ